MIAATRKLTQGSGVRAALVKGSHLTFKTQDMETSVKGVNMEWTQEFNPKEVEVLNLTRESRDGSKLSAPADQNLAVHMLYCTKTLES